MHDCKPLLFNPQPSSFTPKPYPQSQPPTGQTNLIHGCTPLLLTSPNSNLLKMEEILEKVIDFARKQVCWGPRG